MASVGETIIPDFTNQLADARKEKRSTVRLSPLVVSLALISAFFGSYQARSESQAEMTTAACGDYHKSKVALGRTYKKVLKNMAKEGDPERLRNLRTSQKSWEAYTKAHLLVLFPQDPHLRGSMTGMLECGELTPLLRARERQLVNIISKH